jgi:hypothetical protein
MTSSGRELCAAAATQHGVYALAESGCLPSCATCPVPVRECCPVAGESGECRILSEYRKLLLGGFHGLLKAEGGHLEAHDWPLVEEYVNTLLVLARCDQILRVVGTERPVVEDYAAAPERPGESYGKKRVGWDVHALLRERPGWSSLAFRQAESLGLSPAGREKLGLGAGDGAKPAKSLIEIAREKAENRPEGGQR